MPENLSPKPISLTKYHKMSKPPDKEMDETLSFLVNVTSKRLTAFVSE
jgi:hypothetical protein